MFGYMPIPDGGFPLDARFQLEDCVIGNKDKADLGLPLVY